MIKLQDFAREQGVTDRAIQKHLRKYAAEFEGLYERKGPNGTWLTEEACEILRGKMKQQPIVLGDAQMARENADLEKKLDLAEEQLKAARERITELADWKADNSMLIAEASQTKLLLDTTKAELEQAKADNIHQAAELQKAAQEAAEANERADKAEERAQRAEDALEAIKGLPGWKKAWYAVTGKL